MVAAIWKCGHQEICRRLVLFHFIINTELHIQGVFNLINKVAFNFTGPEPWLCRGGGQLLWRVCRDYWTYSCGLCWISPPSLKLISGLRHCVVSAFIVERAELPEFQLPLLGVIGLQLSLETMVCFIADAFVHFTMVWRVYWRGVLDQITSAFFRDISRVQT